jgi:hypothetical protein
MPLSNSRRQSCGGITITSGVEMSLPSRSLSHDGITITSGVEEMALHNTTKRVTAVEPLPLIHRKHYYQDKG